MSKPLLTIAVPTFNRAKELEKCLNTIFPEAANEEGIEVLIGNNASTDQTDVVIRKFMQRYKNIVYVKRSKNIGADQNIFKLMEESNGRYCLLHGDDDYFIPGAIKYIVNVIKSNPGCFVYFITRGHKKIEPDEVHEGMPQFLKKISFTAASISSAILDKEAYNTLKERDKFLYSHLNQIYILYSLLAKNGRFITIGANLMNYTWSIGSYSFGEVYIKNYIDILNYFRGKGLSSEDIKEGKKSMLEEQVIPCYRKWRKEPITITMSDVMKYYEQYYKDEPYFESRLRIMKYIERGYTW